jgi:hypothetical protein
MDETLQVPFKGKSTDNSFVLVFFFTDFFLFLLGDRWHNNTIIPVFFFLFGTLQATFSLTSSYDSDHFADFFCPGIDYYNDPVCV